MPRSQVRPALRHWMHTPIRRAGAPSYVGPFDGITFAALYGLKRYLSSYTGPLIRLRRSSDNEEQDFGYDEETGLLDTAAIATWLGAASGFVVTWYDQSGNGRNATQSTASAQPAYVASEVNGLPVIRFDGSDDYLRTAEFVLTQPNSHILTARGGSGNNNWVDVVSGQRIILRPSGASGWSLVRHTNALSVSGSAATWGIRSALFNGANSAGWTNGGTPATGNLGNIFSGSGRTFGASSAPGEFTACDLADYALLLSSISAADHNTIGAELASLYGLTWNTVS